MNLAFIQGIGPLELTIVLVIVLLVLGPKRLPAMGRSLGAGLKEFKGSITSRHEDADDRADVKGPVESEATVAIGGPLAGSRAATVAERPLEGEAVPERR